MEGNGKPGGGAPRAFHDIGYGYGSARYEAKLQLFHELLHLWAIPEPRRLPLPVRDTKAPLRPHV
jgi:hypothetical protein